MYIYVASDIRPCVSALAPYYLVLCVCPFQAEADLLPTSRAQAGKMPAPLSSSLGYRQSAPKSSQISGSLSLKNWACRALGPCGPADS